MFGKLALETRTKETMKKAGAPCLNLKGNGRWSTAGKDSNHGTDVQKGKPIPNKTEKKNSKWKIQAHLILIREC